MSFINNIKGLFFKGDKLEKRSLGNQNITQRRPDYWKQLAAYTQAYDIQFDDFNQDALERVSVVYQCIDILSNTIARVSTNIITDTNGDGDYEDYKLHPWYKQIGYKPNSLMSDFELRRLIAVSVFTKGNAYVYKNFYTHELQFIHPDLIDHIILKDGNLFYQSSQLGHTFLQNEIIHYTKVKTAPGQKGLSPLEAVRTSTNILHLAEKTTEEYYRHGARSPVVLERDVSMNINAESLEEAIQDLQQVNMNGRFSIREPLVLPPLLKVKELKLTAEDVMFVATSQYSNEQIANLFGLPSFLVYASKGVAGKFEQENLAFKNTTLANYLEMYRSTTVDSLITIEDRIDLNANIVFDMDKLMELDFTSLATNAVQLSNNGLISKNEGRQMLGKKRVNHPNADKLLTQSQWVSVEDRDLSKTTE